ncbi:MAG: FtsQ-type POTRA domain-containing protein [Eubacterium sp.]|nr:FtsQ-type POTRA domain-containing protein [Eubacterium sp.]
MPKEGRDNNNLWVEMPPSGKARLAAARAAAEERANKPAPSEQPDNNKDKNSKKSDKIKKADKKSKPVKKAKPEKATGKAPKKEAKNDFDFNLAKPEDIQKKALKNKSRNRKKTDDKNLPQRRKKLSSYLLYYIIFAVVAVGIICVLSTTVLFNIGEITVSGETQYDEKDVIRLSGVEEGQNLITLDTAEIERKLIKQLPYVDEVKVNKRLPATLEISLTPAEAVANVSKGSAYYLVSRNGRIMDTSLKKPNSKYVTVVGFDPEYASDGDFLTVTDEGNRNLLAKLLKCAKQYSGADDNTDSSAARKYDIMFSLIEDCEAVGIADKIKQIDISNIYNIKLNYDNRLTLELGEYTEVQFKLTIAKNLIDRGEFDGEKGVLILSQLISSSDEMKVTFTPERGNDSNSNTSTDNGSNSTQPGNNGNGTGDNSSGGDEQPTVGDTTAVYE